MERTFDEVYRELADIHSREIKGWKEKTNSWRERFEKLKAQKQKCQEEYHAQRDENRGLCKEVANLLDTISKLQSREVNVKCSMCETLQKSLDTLRQSYHDSLEEKDRIITLLDEKLTEISDGESLLPKLKLRFSTPNKQDGIKAGSVFPTSNRKQSPDSTIRTTPRKEEDETPRNSETLGEERVAKLRLSRGQKRHRYTETISQVQKRQKMSDENKVLSGGKKEQILVPETCDLYNQSNVGAESEITSLDDSLQSPVVYRRNDEGQRSRGDGTGETDDKREADIQIIPETVHFFDDYPSSSSEEEVDDSCTQSTIKRAPNQNYSLRSVLCSPPSSDGEDCATDMRNVVNHKTMHLSGQSVVVEEDTGCEEKIKSAGLNSRSHVSGKNDGSILKISQRESENDTEDKSNRVSTQEAMIKQNNMLSVKPFKKANIQQVPVKYVKRKHLSGEGRKSSQISQNTNQQTNLSTCQSLSSGYPSPITQKVTKDRTEIRSPSLLQGSRSEVGEEPESPSLLRGPNLLDDDVTILDSPASRLREKKSKTSGEISNMLQDKISNKCLQEKLDKVDEEESLCIRSKTKMNLRGSNLSVESTRTSTRNSKSPKKKTLKLSKGSKVELVNSSEDSLSSRQLRQTTLSQVFNSPPKQKKKKTSSQEEEDIQKAIQLSLRDAELVSSHRKNDITTEEMMEESIKENTPPFKKPVIPSKRNRHSSSDSPLKSARSPGKRLFVHRGERSPRKVSTMLQVQRSPGKESSVVRGERSPGSTMVQGQRSDVIDLDETMSPDLRRVEKTSRLKTCIGKRTPSSDDSEYTISRNGSIDPNIHLSVLCDEESELILERIPTKKELFHKEDTGVKESPSIEFDIDEVHVPSLDDSVATLKDFRIDDLKGRDNMLESRHLTSTCIDEDSQSIPCSSRSVKFGSRKKCVIITTGYNSEDEGEDEAQMLEEEEDNDKEEFNDSFDKLPDKTGNKYAYVGVVRKQNERRNLIGYECKECYEYYSAMGLGEEEVKQRVQSCSKHRAHYVPPETPPHFWSVGFPDTQECEERGYINKEEDMDERDIRPAFRRRRKLKKIFKSKIESAEEKKEPDLVR